MNGEGREAMGSVLLGGEFGDRKGFFLRNKLSA
jgi:hypothetical protein